MHHERQLKVAAAGKWMLSGRLKGPSSRSGIGGAVSLSAKRFTLFLGAGLCVVLLVVHFPVTQTYLLERLSSRIEAERGIRVQCKGFWWLPFLGVHVRGLEVRSAGISILSCPEAVLDFGVSPSHRGIVLRGLRLDRPVLRLRKVNGKLLAFAKPVRKRELDGRTNAPRQTGESVWPTDAQGVNIQVSSGEITAEQDGIRVLDIKGVNGSLVLKGDGEITAPFIDLNSLKFSK
ncbi:MAG: hypothetical protein AB9873_06855 [Syntrophobacteraceae bacterium]